MASRASKRRVVEQEIAAPPAKRERRAIKTYEKSPTSPVVKGKVLKPATGKSKSAVPSKKTLTKPKPVKKPPPIRKGTLGVRRVTTRPKPDKHDDDDEGTAVPYNTNSQGTLKGKIFAILADSKKKEKEIMGDDIIDSDDEVSESAPNNTQTTMDGDQNYTKDPNAQLYEYEFEEEEDKDNSVLDLTTCSTKLRQVIQDTSVFDDPNKPHEEWWSEDHTRETTLCELWQEERSLYDFTVKGHMTEDRGTILKRFSTILHVPPHIIETRMASMRNLYQRMHRQCKSGSEPEGRTDRQKEVLRLLYFLRQHIKTSASLTTYKGVSPVKKVAPNMKIPSKSTPKSKSGKPHRSDDKVESYLKDLSGILDHSLTPIKDGCASITPSEVGDGSIEDFVVNDKQFGRNNRLHDSRAVEVSVRRSLRLTPSPTRKKTSNPALVKKTKSSKASSSSVEPTTSSCKDTAPLAKERPKKPASNNGKDDTVPTKITTAEERKKAMVKDKVTASTSSKGLKAAPTVNVPKKHNKQTTAAERKEAMASTSSKDQSRYDISLEQAWHEKQGPAYRRQQELEKKKKEKEKENTFADLMREKNETMKKLTAGVDQWNTRSTTTATAPSSAISPEQLWADSLVPQLQRMEPDTKDEFMVHVLGLAFKAIKGQWPQ